MSDIVGKKFGEYEIIQPIAEGGMAEVFLGYDRPLERYVAVKILSQKLRLEDGYEARFMQEVQIAASLSHPHIIPIYSFGQVDDIYYVVMALLRGGTLANLLENRIKNQLPLPSIAETVNLIHPIASALDYTHKKNIIHRDIKPSNIMFSGDETSHVYLVDFGIARMENAATQFTQQGTPVGTALFMAPEQWRGENITTAVDQYALAIVTYNLLTGDVPFKSQNSAALMYMHFEQQPQPIAHVRSDIHPEIDNVILRAMHKDPAHRYPDIMSFAEALKKVSIWSQHQQHGAGTTGFFVTRVDNAQFPQQPEVAPARPPTPPPVSKPTYQPKTPPASSYPNNYGQSQYPAYQAPPQSNLYNNGPAIDNSRTAGGRPKPIYNAPSVKQSSGIKPVYIVTAIASLILVGAVIALAMLLSGDDAVPPSSSTQNDTLAEQGVVLVALQPNSEYTVGANSNQFSQLENPHPASKVAALTDYYLDQTEVTNVDYQQFIDGGGYTNAAYWTDEGWNWIRDITPPETSGGDNMPRTGITWYEAYAYCRFVGGRLPTEAEWEIAARDSQPEIQLYNPSNYQQSNINYNTPNGRTQPVKSTVQNTLGLYEMLGNAREWTATQDIDTGLYVIKGGSYLSGQREIAIPSRMLSIPDFALNADIGFRCAYDELP